MHSLLILALTASFGSSAEHVDFTTDVRPILARHCFKCHGPDDKVRKANLRLDLRESSLRVLGKPGDSELLRRIGSRDPGVVMPPPATKNPLSPDQRRVLTRWIEQGAQYTEHWAFQAPRRPAYPAIKQTNWPRNGIDRFVLARLEAEGHQPSPEADRLLLARRVHLDLLGVPPTPSEADELLRDLGLNAYERLVDRLLADPRYGERWTRRWLDLARYADTNGYEKDRARSIWPYRDWVIQAINADMPFDRFTIEQLAGDMLPNAGEAQRIATGFHRNTMLNEEGGIDPLEFRFHAMTDRVATTGVVWLGLTLGCAQCHSHKFDPVSQREYYRLFALLNNADEPVMDVHRSDIEGRRLELQKQIDSMLGELPKKLAKAELDTKFADWLKRERERTVPWQVLRPVSAGSNLPLLTIQSDDSVFVNGDQTKSDTYRLKFRTQPGVKAIRLEALPDDRLPRHGPGRVYYEGSAGDFTLCEFRVIANGKRIPVAKATHSFAVGGFTSEKAIDGHPQTGWSIDGGQGRAHFAVFQLAQPLAGGEFEIEMLFERHFAAGLGRFRMSATRAEKPAMARDAGNDIEALLSVDPARLSDGERQTLVRHFLTTAPEMAQQRQAVDAMRKQMPAFPTSLVMHERPKENPRPTFIHNRGEWLQPTERVEPGVPAFLPALPDRESNRLGFARWLVSAANPLTARVTVNRHWAYFFGSGLVRTVQDFGYTGDAPTNQPLLDWLAVEFMQRNWSMKELHRLIVTSATYRQARGPRIRLEAEVIRDSALHSAGLLSQKMGGPSVFPAQPANVTTEGAYGQLSWRPSEGEDRYRRGLYTFSKRTAPYAMFATFDGPSGEFCSPRREVSNTPLQALTMLNDLALRDAAQELGRQLSATPGPTEQRVHLLFRRCLTRPPNAAELAALVRFFDAQRLRLAKSELDAATVAGPGDAAIDRAAWTLLARALLNLDEMIVRE